jgi:hypothetical protein
MADRDWRRDAYFDIHDDYEIAGRPRGIPGKSTVTSRMAPVPVTNVIFRVADPATANALAQSLPNAFAERDANGVAAGAEDAVARAASTSGQPLPAAVRERFEGSLGTRVGGVRVHTGPESAAAAAAVGARAFTVGQDIHFATGQYDPASPRGLHLLAHEVAHTAQQASSGVSGPQYKLTVSSPLDSAEREADAAADAMVRGEAATVGPHAPALARHPSDPASWIREERDRGAAEMALNQIKTPAPALQVSNVRDIAGAESNLRVLASNHPILEQGASHRTTTLDNPGTVTSNMVVNNGAAMADLRMFLAAARQQSNSTSNFQQQYATLLRDFGGLEAMAQKHCGGSIKDIKPDGAADLVELQAGSGGTSSEDLSAAFESVMNEPSVVVALTTVQTTASELVGLPARVQQASARSSGALGKLDAALMRLQSAVDLQAAQSLRQQFAAAKAKAAKASGIIGGITSMLQGSAKEGYKDGKAAMTNKPIVARGDGTLGHGNTAGLNEAILKGLGTGGTALLGLAVDEVWKLVKPQIDALMVELNISVGQFPNTQDKAAEAKEIEAAYHAAKAAEQEISNAKKTLATDAAAYFTAAKELDTKKKAMDRSIEALGNVVVTALTKTGKKAEGEQLTELMAFVSTGQNFIAQADTVYRIGTQELDARNDQTAAHEARQHLTEFNRGGGRTVYMAYVWTSNRSGKITEHVSAQPVSMTIDTAGSSRRIAESPAEAGGMGSADGHWNNDQMGANRVIANSLRSVKDMTAKTDAYVKAVNGMIFGGALAPR